MSDEGRSTGGPPAVPAGSVSMDDLQLDRAEFARPESSPSCAGCGRPLSGSYWEVQGKTVCADCRQRVEEKLAGRPGADGFLRALAAGIGAAAAGAGIYYAVSKLTGYQLSLISILVGYMVGRAVRWGVQGRGGWPAQTLAVTLTYLAIVASFVPPVLASLDGRPVPPDAYGSLARYLLGAPIFGGRNSILGLVIVAFGLYQAWKLNSRPRLSITGPHAIAPPGFASRQYFPATPPAAPQPPAIHPS